MDYIEENLDEIDPMKMKALENKAEKSGISKLLLMENAGAKLAVEIIKKFKDIKNKNIIIVCGSGNNGGDGMVCARHLCNFSKSISLFLLTSGELIKTKENKTNWQIIKQIKSISSYEYIDDEKFFNKFREVSKSADIIIDSIFGTGLKGSIKNPASQIIEIINKSNSFKVAVDIPSGIDPNNGNIQDKCVKANMTVTFHKSKPGIKNKINITGEVIVVQIGIPPELENQL